MVEECIHICANGQKCRRIAKRGQKYCASHRPRRPRPRAAFDEDQEFKNALFAFIDRLHAMSFEDLLYAASDALADVHPLIDRRCSRHHRALFYRANLALTLTAERITKARNARLESTFLPPPPSPSISPLPQAPVPESLQPFQLDQIAALLKIVTNSPNLPAPQLAEICERLLTTLDPNASTVPILFSNTSMPPAGQVSSSHLKTK